MLTTKKKSNFTMEKIRRHYLNQMMKFTTTTNVQIDIVCHSARYEVSSYESKLRDSLQNYCLIIFKNVKGMKLKD